MTYQIRSSEKECDNWKKSGLLKIKISKALVHQEGGCFTSHVQRMGFGAVKDARKENVEWWEAARCIGSS